MRHRLKCRVFDALQLLSTFTTNSSGNPHSVRIRKLHSKSTYFYRWWVPGLCASALLFGGLIAISPQTDQAYADENSDIALYSVDPAISLTFNPDASFTGNANINEVSYITNTFTVNVNKYANYTVKLNAMNGSGTELRGRDNSMAVIKGVGNKVAPANFASNTWGYSYSENTDTNPDTLTYSSMPAFDSDENMISKPLTGTEENKTDDYLLAFAAKIGADSPADHYVGNFLLSVVGQAFVPEIFTLNYNINNGTGIINAQSCTQTQVNGSCKLTVTNDEPTRKNYTFLGWADSANATEAQYTAGSDITLSKTTTLFAVWQSNVVTVPFNGITTMQAMTSGVCSGASEETEGILEDTRDHKTYYVAKLKDGNCWMTQNLAYGTVDDTSIGTPCKLSRTDGNPAANNATCTDGTSWTDSYTDKYFAIGKHDDGNHTSQGNFYNWPAAVQNGTGGTNIQGVCPTGWQLPVSNASTTTDRSFNKLVTAYGANNNADGSTIIRGEPMYFQYSGVIYSRSLNSADSLGSYWSPTPSDSNNAYNLFLSNSSAIPSNDYYRYCGFSVRCVAQ